MDRHCPGLVEGVAGRLQKLSNALQSELSNRVLRIELLLYLTRRFRPLHSRLVEIFLGNKGRIQSLVVRAEVVGALAELTIAPDKTSDVALHIRRVLVDGFLLMLHLLNQVVVVGKYQRILTHQKVTSVTLVGIVHVIAHHWVLSE